LLATILKHTDPQWTPYALLWYFVTITAALAITFAATVFALYWHSNKNDGLCSEDSAMPGWKFVPTLIAVLYTQLRAMIFDAVKRTEPFAKMARTNGRIPVCPLHFTRKFEDMVDDPCKRLPEEKEWRVMELGYHPLLQHLHPGHTWNFAHLCCFIVNEGGVTNKL
jgi:hypothetical protein